jgi:tetratricopeptide (TPR) repeat protein
MNESQCRPVTEWRAPNPILSVFFFIFSLTAFLALNSFVNLPFAYAEIIQLKNGNAIETKILKEDDEFVVVEAPGGKVKIPKSDIQTIWRGPKSKMVEVRGKEVYFSKGVELYKAGKFKASAASFERSLGPNAVGAIIYANLGSSYASAGMDPKAEENFWKALQADPKNYDNLLNAAHFYERKKIYKKAIEMYKKCLVQKPNDASLKRSLAFCEYGAGHYLKAAKLYESLGEKNDVVASCNAAAAYIQAGKLDKAEAILETLLKSPSPIPRAYVNMAHLYRLRKDYDQAETYYREGLKREPKNTEIYIGLGQMYLEMKDWDSAKSNFEAVLLKKPQHRDAIQGMVKVFVEKKDIDQAVAYYEKLGGKNSRDPRYLNGLGLLYLKANEPEKAVKVYQQIFETHEKNARAHANAGLAYALLNDADNALKEWNRALEINPKMEAAAQNKKILEEIMQGSRSESDVSK